MSRGIRMKSASRASFREWLIACTAGELLGFGAAAVWAFIAFRIFGADPVSWAARVGVLALMVLAGVFEGTVLGLFQWMALRRTFATLEGRAWIGATIAVAALGWFAGMLPSTFATPHDTGAGSNWEPPLALILAGAAVFGAIAGAVFGFAQWIVLRHHALNARKWITANALGWAVGLPWSYLAGSIGDVTRSVPWTIGIGIVAGALMGASVALATGRALVGMISLTPTSVGR